MLADDDRVEQKGRAAVQAIQRQVDDLMVAVSASEEGMMPTTSKEWASRSRMLKESLIPTHSRVTAQLTALKEWARQREEARKQAEQWHEQLQQQKRQWTDEIASLRQRTQEAESETHLSRAARDTKNAEAAEAEEQLERQRQQGTDAPGPSDPGSRYLRFLTGRAEMMVECDAAAARFSTLDADGEATDPGCDPKVWDEASLAELGAEAARFAQSLPEREAELQRLNSLALPLRQDTVTSSWDTSLESAEASLAAARAAFARWDRKLQQEQRRREEYERNTDDFMANQRKLVDWCAEQRSKLEVHVAGTGPGAEVRKNVHEFCQSLQSRIPFMEENFAVLAGMAEDLVPGPKSRIVEHALVDATGDWLRLQIYAYESLRDTLVAEHKASGLKEECRAFSQFAGEKVKGFMEKVEELLRTPEDDPSKSIVRPALETCKALQHDFPPHQLIIDHLHDFEVRMDIINDHYEKLKKTMLSRLTFLCLKLTALNTGFRGKEEHDERMTNISTWVETKDGNTVAWEEVEQRLEEIKQLIDKEAETDVTLEEA